MMRRIALATAICTGFAVPAAADYESGQEAFRAGEYATAVVRLQASAETGDAASQHLLGQINEKGLGVPQNFLRAHVWYNLAAGQGHEDAVRARDALTKRMAAEEVAKAQARASEWLPVGTTGGDGPVAFSVTSTQRLLVRLGYDPGSVDGILKARTRDAIRDFQGRSDIEANGRLTPDLFAALAKSAGVEIMPGGTAAVEPAAQSQKVAREQAVREAEARATAARESAARETAARESAARESSAREEAAREAAAREAAARKAAARESDAREDEAARRVTAIQARLRQMGYDVPSVSGQADGKTRAAIRTYEADQGMTVTGTASQAVLDRMNAQARDEAVRERELVRRVQSRLDALGYDAGPADGAMGTRTGSAIEMFQEKRDLPVNGKVSAELAANLDAAVAEQEAAETARTEGVQARAAAETEQLILAVETELNRRGYDAGVEDGVVTDQTTRAVGDYQKDAAIEADGEVSEALLARIRADDSNVVTTGLSPAQVTDLERALEDRGYRIGAVDGRVDGDLRAAIRLYQADVGRDVTGEPSAELLADVESRAISSQSPAGALIEGLTGRLLEGRDTGTPSE